LDTSQLGELIEAGDLNGLLRAVDALCGARDWDGLLDLADRCEDAAERGKQLWPIAAHVDYRIALEAPGEYAARILDPEAGRFATGPLTEVAASTHTWAELAPFIGAPQDAAYVAQERVLRGERLEGDGRTHPEVLEMPLSLQPWEPTYALARYLAHTVEVAEPWDPKAAMRPMDRSETGEELDEPELVQALLDLVQPWTSESNGAARAVVVEGRAEDAVSAVSFGPVLYGELQLDEALQRVAWTAASGGAHGRRRGAAFGRSMAWHVSALLADVGRAVDPEAFGAEVGALNWFRFEETQDTEIEGWFARLAVEDRDNGWAAALSASDVRESDVADQ
jgi:hypothetical protein